MDNTSLLATCLKVTGIFENGTLSFDTVAGDSDGEGISVGILQWNAGQGTLQHLVGVIGETMGWPKAQTFFHSDIQHFAGLAPAAAVEFAKQHYLDNTHPARLAPAAEIAWQHFLTTPESVATQIKLAETTTLAEAQRMAAKYVSEDADHSRVVAFFFDLINQEGSMSTVPASTGKSGAEAIEFAKVHDHACAALWETRYANDGLANQLLFYAYERAKLGRAAYIWDSLSRRGTIACRQGIVHGSSIDLTGLLD